MGEQLREAQDTGGGAAVRALDDDRRSVLRRVEDEARALAAEHEQALSPTAVSALHQTMLAALSDPDAADVVRSGLLVAALDPPGFGPVDVSGATAVPVDLVPRPPRPVPRRRRAEPPADRVAEQRAKAAEAARQQLARAQHELERAEDAAAATRARREEAAHRREAAEQRLAEVTQQLADLDRAATDAEAGVAAARRRLDQAEAAHRRHR